MKERRDSTWVTPLRSMRNRLMLQLPLLMLLSRLAVMTVVAMTLLISNTAALLALPKALSACNQQLVRSHSQPKQPPPEQIPPLESKLSSDQMSGQATPIQEVSHEPADAPGSKFAEVVLLRLVMQNQSDE